MPRILRLSVLLSLVACTPYNYALAPEGQADAQRTYDMDSFTAIPPPGRWIAERLPPHLAARGWPPRMQLIAFPTACKPAFQGFDGDIACFVERIAARPLRGVVFCEVPKKQWGLDSKPDSLSACILLRVYDLKPQYRGDMGNKAALDTLRVLVTSTVEEMWQEETTFWESLTMKSSGPRRGSLRKLSIGFLDFDRVVTVAQADSSRIVHGRVDEQALIHLQSDLLLLVTLNSEAAWLSPGSVEWAVIESIRLTSSHE